ncbi:MAG: hypothetical protein LAT68_16600 [Cyclobacteriaceae bacterium]|nr:hypothetical protein [Cyclobacteriaceae bacterium]MCH8517923.1 hypothetical protein [Cyclobacteriaceae bacterium]
MPRFINTSIVFALSLITVFACSGEKKEGKGNKSSSTYTFEYEKLDSLLIDNLTELNLLHWNESRSEGLFLDREQERVIRVDEQGDILDAYVVLGDRPDALGRWLSGAYLMDDGRFYLSGARSMNLYDKDGKLVKIISTLKDDVLERFNFNSENMILWNDEIFIKSRGVSGFDRTQAEFYLNYRSLAHFTPETEEFDDMVEIPMSSIYRNGNSFQQGSISFSHFVDPETNLLYIMFSGDPAVYAYEYNEGDPKLVAEMKLDTEDMDLHEGTKMGEKQDNSRGRQFRAAMESASFTNHRRIGDFHVVTYSEGMEDGPELEVQNWRSYMAEMNKRLKLGYQVFQGEELLARGKGNFYPETFSQFIMLKDGTMMVKYTNEEEEEDFQKFYIIKAKVS